MVENRASGCKRRIRKRQNNYGQLLALPLRIDSCQFFLSDRDELGPYIFTTVRIAEQVVERAVDCTGDRFVAVVQVRPEEASTTLPSYVSTESARKFPAEKRAFSGSAQAALHDFAFFQDLDLPTAWQQFTAASFRRASIVPDRATGRGRCPSRHSAQSDGVKVASDDSMTQDRKLRGPPFM